MVLPTRLASADATIIDLQPAADDLTAEVLAGLTRPDQKTLPCKLFYDQRGSEIFEEICKLPEYYPTRTEVRIMRDYQDEIEEAVGSDALVLEPGSGAGMKTRLLLHSLNRCAGYVALEIDGSILERAGRELAASYPQIPIVMVCADYNKPFQLPDALPEHHRRLLYFPGSTIGNLHPQRAVKFLERAREWVGRSGCMIIGVDTPKSRDVLEAAYDDAAGVTARFNLNALLHLNKALGCDFNLDCWEHEAVFDTRRSRIEMHLVSRRNQVVQVVGRSIYFEQGETIRTECSYKYEPAEFQALARKARLRPRRCWTDRQNMFSIHFLEMPDSDYETRFDLLW